MVESHIDSGMKAQGTTEGRENAWNEVTSKDHWKIFKKFWSQTIYSVISILYCIVCTVKRKGRVGTRQKWKDMGMHGN